MTTLDDMLAGEPPEVADFQRLYGPWQALTPIQVRDFFDGFDAPWWIAGGWAIEAFTKQPRKHEDVDVAIFMDDLPRLCAFVADRFHVWGAGSGGLRPLNDDYPELPAGAGQVWLRRDAWSPWIMDCLLNPGSVAQWISRRDPTWRAPLASITWESDGVRYLVPEVALAFKAKHARAKDHADLAAALPLLSSAARLELRSRIEALHPGHEWLPLM